MKRLRGTAGPRKAKRRALESWATTSGHRAGERYAHSLERQARRDHYRDCWTTRGGTWFRWHGSLRGYDVTGVLHDGRQVIR